MTEMEKNRIEQLRDRQPFRVPEGYFEGFTENFMRNLPERKAAEPKVISFYDRVKPWLYIAAILVGVVILFNVFIDKSAHSDDRNKGVLSSVKVDANENDDADFVEIFEEMYVDKYALSYIIDDYMID
jgi:hypothetical protein